MGVRTIKRFYSCLITKESKNKRRRIWKVQKGLEFADMYSNSTRNKENVVRKIV